jgi:hypothetical protein
VYLTCISVIFRGFSLVFSVLIGGLNVDFGVLDVAFGVFTVSYFILMVRQQLFVFALDMQHASVKYDLGTNSCIPGTAMPLGSLYAGQPMLQQAAKHNVCDQHYVCDGYIVCCLLSTRCLLFLLLCKHLFHRGRTMMQGLDRGRPSAAVACRRPSIGHLGCVCLGIVFLRRLVF